MAFTWSYSGNPASSDKDAVRFIIGDTDSNDQLVSDEEIAYAVSVRGSVFLGAAMVAKSIASRYARNVDKAVGDLKISLSQKFKAYNALAEELEEKAVNGVDATVDFFTGGISIQDKLDRQADSDRPDPYFRRGQFSSDNEQNDRDDPKWYPGGF